MKRDAVAEFAEKTGLDARQMKATLSNGSIVVTIVVTFTEGETVPTESDVLRMFAVESKFLGRVIESVSYAVAAVAAEVDGPPAVSDTVEKQNQKPVGPPPAGAEPARATGGCDWIIGKEAGKVDFEGLRADIAGIIQTHISAMLDAVEGAGPETYLGAVDALAAQTASVARCAIEGVIDEAEACLCGAGVSAGAGACAACGAACGAAKPTAKKE